MESKYLTIQLSIPKEGKFTLQGSRQTQLLVEALKVSSDRISPQPTIKEMTFADATDRVEVEIVTQLIKLQRCHVANTFIEKWENAHGIGQMALLVNSLENHVVKLGQVVCEGESDCKMICSLLSISTLQSWIIDNLEFGSDGHKIREMQVKKSEVIQLTIGCWTDDCKTSLPPNLFDCLSWDGVVEIKMEKVDCTGESSLDRLISLLSIPTLQSWTIDHLEMIYHENSWQHLAVTPVQGSIKDLTLKREFSLNQDAKHWVREAEEAVNFGVHCGTNEEMKTLCTVLGFAKEWRLDRLILTGDIGSEGWEALSKVASKGKVDRVDVSTSAFRAANNQQVEALWKATDWWWLDGGGIIAKNNESDNDAGLKELLTFRSQVRRQTIPQNRSTAQLRNRSTGDADLENRGKCCQLL